MSWLLQKRKMLSSGTGVTGSLGERIPAYSSPAPPSPAVVVSWICRPSTISEVLTIFSRPHPDILSSDWRIMVTVSVATNVGLYTKTEHSRRTETVIMLHLLCPI